MSEPILELPGITVTRESIKLEGREVALGGGERVFIEEGPSAALPSLLRQWLRVAVVVLPAWLVLPFMTAQLLYGDLLLPAWLKNTLIVIDNIGGVMFLSALFLTLLFTLLWLVFRKRVYFTVQLKTTEGTIRVYKARDSEKAQHVLKAIESAIEDTVPPPLPTPN